MTEGKVGPPSAREPDTKELENRILNKLQLRALIIGIPAILTLVLALIPLVAGKQGPPGDPGVSPDVRDIVKALKEDKGIQSELKMVANSGLERMVAFFVLQDCPTGWERYEEASGRYIVALVDKGALEGVVGKVLTDKEDRVVGLHSHNISGEDNHTHAINDGGNHVHSYKDKYTGAWRGKIVDQNNYDNFAITEEDRATSGGGVHKHGVEPAGKHYHQIGDAGTIDGTNAPYLQLLACKKKQVLTSRP